MLGSAAWMATRRGGKADAATVPLATRLAQGTAAAPATPAQTGVATQPSAPASAAAANTVQRSAEQRAANLRRKQQDDERRRQEAETLRQTQLLQQQLAAAQGRTLVAQPAPQQPAPVQAQPQPQQVAVAQPQRPAPQPVAPPPAPAPAREEPAAPSSSQVFDEDGVEQRPRLTNVNELQRALQDRYPAQLQANRVSGSVTASFVVGANGRVDPSTIHIVNSPNPGFNAPTQSVLRRARFRPATVKGQAVRVQVTMPIAWTLDQ